MRVQIHRKEGSPERHVHKEFANTTMTVSAEPPGEERAAPWAHSGVRAEALQKQRPLRAPLGDADPCGDTHARVEHCHATGSAPVMEVFVADPRTWVEGASGTRTPSHMYEDTRSSAPTHLARSRSAVVMGLTAVHSVCPDRHTASCTHHDNAILSGPLP